MASCQCVKLGRCKKRATFTSIQGAKIAMNGENVEGRMRLYQ